MVRFIVRMAFVAVFLVSIFLIYLWVERVFVLERFLSKKLHARVSLDEININFDSFEITGLRIESLSKSYMPYAFSGGVIVVEMNLLELFKSKVHIKRIKIIDPKICLELYNSYGNDNNWAHILNNLPMESPGKKFALDQLMMSNLQFEVFRSNGRVISLPAIPYLEFKNFGSRNGLTMPELSKIVFQTILYTLTKRQSLGGILDNVSLMPQTMLNGMNSTLPLDESRTGFQDGLDLIKRKTKEASEFFQDLFSGK